MRGKTATLVFHEGVETRDDLGRSVQTVDTGVEVIGSVSAPSVSKRREPEVSDVDAVAFIPADAPVSIGRATWVEVTIARSDYQLGRYSIARMSGGHRVLRLDLKRIDTRDGAHGKL